MFDPAPVIALCAFEPSAHLTHVQVQQTHIKAKYLLGLTEERPGPELAANMTRYGMGQVCRTVVFILHTVAH
jgi:hypothetical protein